MGFFSKVKRVAAAVSTGGISEVGRSSAGESVINQLTGKAAGDAARDAANIQVSAAEAAQAQLAARTKPFEELGQQAGGQLIGSVLGQDQFAQPQLQSAEDVLNNPFFAELSRAQDEQEINRRSALGLGGSGGTLDALKRQTLQLGNQFQQQDFGNQQQVFSNQMAQNQQRFQQLFNTTGLGANAAIGAGTQIANLQTGAGAAQAAGLVGEANARGAGIGNLLNIGGAVVGGLTGGIGGLGAGGGGGLGAGSSVGGLNPNAGFLPPSAGGGFGF